MSTLRVHSILSDELVAKIRKLKESGITVPMLVKRFGVPRSTINRIVYRYPNNPVKAAAK